LAPPKYSNFLKQRFLRLCRSVDVIRPDIFNFATNFQNGNRSIQQAFFNHLSG